MKFKLKDLFFWLFIAAMLAFVVSSVVDKQRLAKRQIEIARVEAVEQSEVAMQAQQTTIQQSVLPQVIEPKEIFGKNVKQIFQAKVVGVTDGDTIKILGFDNQQIRVRLDSIDCPESKQAFDTEAKQAMNAFVFGKVVTIEKTGEDRYGRTLAFVLVDGVNTSAEMIRQGYAWHYKEYSDDETLAQLETEARNAKRGLWQDAEPIPPWEWRKQYK